MRLARSFGTSLEIVSQSTASYPDAVSVSQRASASADATPTSARRRPIATRWLPQVGRVGTGRTHSPPSELATALVGGELIDELVEIALEHAIERVDRQPDAVVGDPVLLVVVGADLLERPPLFTCSLRADECASSWRSCWSCNSRARRIAIARSRF